MMRVYGFKFSKAWVYKLYIKLPWKWACTNLVYKTCKISSCHLQIVCKHFTTVYKLETLRNELVCSCVIKFGMEYSVVHMIIIITY